MNKSYKSIEDILKNTEPIFSHFKEDYWAHINGRKPTEGLFEHSRLVADYLEKIIVAHGIEPIIEGAIDKLCDSAKFKSPERSKFYIKELFINSIFPAVARRRETASHHKE